MPSNTDSKVVRISLLTVLLVVVMTLTALLILRVHVATYWKWTLGLVLYATFVWIMTKVSRMTTEDERIAAQDELLGIDKELKEPNVKNLMP